MTSSNMSLSISIVTFKTEPSVLAEALASITNSTIPATVYVVDNSPLPALRLIAEQYKAAYIHTGKNIGFGRAHNLALKIVKDTSKYHLILNPDISFGPDVLEELHGFLEMNPDIGWVMPNVLYPDGSRQKLCKRLPNPWDLFSRRFLHCYGLGFLATDQRRFECSDLDLSKPRSIPYLSGCFALVRTELLRATGGFDERYFMYLEDTDLVRRIGEIALTVYYPYASVHHVHGRGSYRNFKLLTHHLFSSIRYFCKWGWLFDSRRAEINRSLAFEEQEIAIPARLGDWATN